MNKHDQPQSDMLDDVFDACFGTAVYINERPIDEVLKAKLLARGDAMNDSGKADGLNVAEGEPANQPMPNQRKARKAA